MSVEKPDRELTVELRAICRQLLESNDRSIIPAIKRLGILIPKVRNLENQQKEEYTAPWEQLLEPDSEETKTTIEWLKDLGMVEVADHIWENPAWKSKQDDESPTGQSK